MRTRNPARTFGIGLAMLPALNRQLALVLKDDSYLAIYDTVPPADGVRVTTQVQPVGPLAPREQEVLEQLLAGQSNREIAESLVISENTVKTHAKSIYSKYGVSGRTQLMSLLLASHNPG